MKNKEDFKTRLIEEELFEEVKDTSIRSSRYFKEKYEGSGIDFSRLYRRIINYQIRTYGEMLSNPTFVINRNNIIRRTNNGITTKIAKLSRHK